MILVYLVVEMLGYVVEKIDFVVCVCFLCNVIVLIDGVVYVEVDVDVDFDWLLLV